MVRSVPLIGAETVMASAMSLLGVVAHALPVPSCRAPERSGTRRLAAGSCARRWLLFGDVHGHKVVFTSRAPHRRSAPGRESVRLPRSARPKGRSATDAEPRDQAAV